MKASDQGGGDREERKGRGRTPALARRARRRIDEQHQPRGHGDGAGDVEVAVRDVETALRQEHRRERDRDDCDRDVDEEDPRPAQVRGQDAAEQDAHGRTAARGGPVDAERDVALASLGVDRHQERQRGRREERAAEPLQRPEADQRRLRPREPAEKRAHGEERQPRDEEPAPPEDVGEPAAQQQRSAEHDRVGGDDPLQARLGEVEIRLDRRQRDVHDGHVEDDHELCDDDQCESGPAVGLCS